MELKTKYQYTYFLHTFIINEKKYDKYILNLLKKDKFKFTIFDKRNDFDIYTFFLPKIRNFLFKSFELGEKQKFEKFCELPIETKAAVLSEYDSICFEYDIKKDIQGKTIDKDSIFFKIQKIGLIVFKTGICFLYLKTNLENNEDFSNILNFNYKFKDITQDENSLKNFENIKIQTDLFENVMELKKFILALIENDTESENYNLDIQKFYTYSYTCIEQEQWNATNTFESIQDDFSKYVNVMPSDANTLAILPDNVKILNNSKYSKLGISKTGVSVLSSDREISNYTSLPRDFEKQYFYTYVFALYVKIYLNKIKYKMKKEKNLKKVRKEFVDFTKNIWLQEITTLDFGSIYYKYLKDVLEIEEIYKSINIDYTIFFSELKIEKNEKISIISILALIVTFIIHIINLSICFR